MHKAKNPGKKNNIVVYIVLKSSPNKNGSSQFPVRIKTTEKVKKQAVINRQ